ncbi:MAG: phospholipid scramblase-related protein [Candidatus Woesearchaeota archaeon]|jgi:uncharacterized protein YxjI|nr:phospholipid scramblase-related protein [Candidatus Woesearchaeota archaeon]
MELNYNKLIVKQKFEGLEAFTGIETKNKYQILTEGGNEVLYAFEESNWFMRILLKKMRSLDITFINPQKETFLKVNKKFAFFLPQFDVYDNNKQLIGIVKTRFGLTSKIEVYDNNNQLIFFTKNEIMHPWTFNIYKSKVMENSIGLISKKWSGVGKEMFTDADNFLIDFDQISDENDKKIILALALIIDLFVFERK